MPAQRFENAPDKKRRKVGRGKRWRQPGSFLLGIRSNHCTNHTGREGTGSVPRLRKSRHARQSAIGFLLAARRNISPWSLRDLGVEGHPPVSPSSCESCDAKRHLHRDLFWRKLWPFDGKVPNLFQECLQSIESYAIFLPPRSLDGIHRAWEGPLYRRQSNRR